MKPNHVIYGTPTELPSKIPFGAWVFVIEMNTDTNKIEGIGLIRNTDPERSVPIHRRHGINLNRFIYRGKYYISRDDMSHTDLDDIERLEAFIFHGKTHLKRGPTITLFPMSLFEQHEKYMIQLLRTLFIEYNIRDLMNKTKYG